MIDIVTLTLTSVATSRPATVLSNAVFAFDVAFAAITAVFLAVFDQSNSCTLIGRLGSIAVVSYIFIFIHHSW